jgi:hypothetical protein
MVSVDEVRKFKCRLRHNYEFACRSQPVDACRERHLHTSKWFDYRFMSPWEATEKFVKDYQAVFCEQWRKNMDRDEAALKRAVAGSGLDDAREFTSFLRARQLADELGVPYRFFIDAAMNKLLRDGYKKLPRPNQLYGTAVKERVIIAVSETWQEYLEAKFQVSAAPQYRNEVAVEHGDQAARKAHQDHVVRELKNRREKPYLIARACFVDRVLPEDRAVHEFGHEKMQAARLETCIEPEAPVTVVDRVDMLPSCFGVAHAFDGSSDECQQCPLWRQCSVAEESVRQQLMSKLKTDDPVLAQRRQLGRERTARCRAKKRAA